MVHLCLWRRTQLDWIRCLVWALRLPPVRHHLTIVRQHYCNFYKITAVSETSATHPHFHMVQAPKSRISINSESPWTLKISSTHRSLFCVTILPFNACVLTVLKFPVSFRMKYFRLDFSHSCTVLISSSQETFRPRMLRASFNGQKNVKIGWRYIRTEQWMLEDFRFNVVSGSLFLWFFFAFPQISIFSKISAAFRWNYLLFYMVKTWLTWYQFQII